VVKHDPFLKSYGPRGGIEEIEMPRYLSLATEFVYSRWAVVFFRELSQGASLESAVAEAEAYAGRPLGAPGMCLAYDSRGGAWIIAANQKRLRIVSQRNPANEVVIWKTPGYDNVVRVRGTVLAQYFP
jgi:hypothetical protein